MSAPPADPPRPPARPAGAFLLPAGMRDLLPHEAESRRALGRGLVDRFELHGYQPVTLPAFELADVLERGLGALDPREVLRFVEPESGRVAALRPDMTPQIARMAATRLAGRPPPMRLAYEGTVLRRRQGRARRHRQIPQAGVELIGVGEPDGDVELLLLAADAARAAGLVDFVIDVGHAEIARALLAGAPEPIGAALVDALVLKDAPGIGALVDRWGPDAAIGRAVRALPDLGGDELVWPRARTLLDATPAGPAVAALRGVWDRAAAGGIGACLRADFGEVRGLAYYTGPVFHVLAGGPGEAVASGGRYDDLCARFGMPTPAAGFAFDLDNLAWALGAAGRPDARASRLLLGPAASRLAGAIRAAGVPCAVGPRADLEGYARAWGFSHLFAGDRPLELRAVESGRREPIPDGRDAEIALWLASHAGTR